MVSVEEGSTVTAKIIDLGLAKALNEPGSQTAIPAMRRFEINSRKPFDFRGAVNRVLSQTSAVGLGRWVRLE
jgi:hypothetical protein